MAEQEAVESLQVQDEMVDFQSRLLKTEIAKLQILRLAMEGKTATEAAKVMGLSAETVRGYYRDPEFRLAARKKVEAAFADVDGAFRERRKTLHEMLEEQAYRSCEDLIEMLNSDDAPLLPSLKVKIHQDFMNRVNDSKPLSGAVMKLDPAELRHAANVAAEMDNVISIKRKTG